MGCLVNQLGSAPALLQNSLFRDIRFHCREIDVNQCSALREQSSSNTLTMFSFDFTLWQIDFGYEVQGLSST